MAGYLPKSASMDGGGHIQVRPLAGSFLVVLKAMTYILSLGKHGIPEAALSVVKLA